MIYQVPQFINEEVKIMGIITFTQLWILLSITGFLGFLFFVLPHWLFSILAFFLIPSGLLMTFSKTNGMPLYKVILAALRHFWLPKYYLWKKNRISDTITSGAENNSLPDIKQSYSNKKQVSPATLEKLTNILDQ